MHISLQGATPGRLASLGTSKTEIHEVIERVVDKEAARDLALILSLRPGVGWTAVCHPGYLTPQDVHNGTVPGLPQHFRLIRIAMGTKNTYPFTGRDAYGWQWAFGTVADHLAEVLAHECYHLRRPAGQEAGANDFALERTLALDFDVAGAPPDGR